MVAPPPPPLLWRAAEVLPPPALGDPAPTLVLLAAGPGIVDTIGGVQSEIDNFYIKHHYFISCHNHKQLIMSFYKNFIFEHYFPGIGNLDAEKDCLPASLAIPLVADLAAGGLIPLAAGLASAWPGPDEIRLDGGAILD